METVEKGSLAFRKPDSHILELFGSKYLGLSESPAANPLYATGLIDAIASRTGSSPNYVDYIFWASVAKSYGEIPLEEIKQYVEED